MSKRNLLSPSTDKSSGPSTSSTEVRRILEHGIEVASQISKKNESNPVRPCRVCDSRDNVGNHFGGSMCSSCNNFYRRALADPLNFYIRPCITRKQTCLLTPDNLSCQFCRVKKCLSVGFNRNFMTEKGGRYCVDPSESWLKPQTIGIVDCEEIVRLLKRAAAWGKRNKRVQHQMDASLKNAIRRGLSNKWYATHRPGDQPSSSSAEPHSDDVPILSQKRLNTTMPRPILPKAVECSQRPVIVIQTSTASSSEGTLLTLSEPLINQLISQVTSALPNSGPQIAIQVLNQPSPLTPAQIGQYLADSLSGQLERVNRIRFENEPAVFEYIDVTSSNAKRFLYNTYERPILEHWRRIEAHINDQLCALVKFTKFLPDFDRLTGDEQHALLSGTLIEMFFVASVFFIDENSKRFYLNSGCVYSQPYLANVFSGCSGAGDFFRSLFDFCRKLRSFVLKPIDTANVSYELIGIVLGLTLFSPPPDSKVSVAGAQTQFLDLLKSAIADVTSLLECLSGIGNLANKHKKMVTSIRDDANIDLAVDLHAELLQLPPRQ